MKTIFWRSPNFDRKTIKTNENLGQVRLQLYQTSEKAPPLREILATRLVLTEVTFVEKKKMRYYEEIRLTFSTKESKLYQNVDTKPSKPRNHQPNKTQI